jgi:hypothetical protein
MFVRPIREIEQIEFDIKDCLYLADRRLLSGTWCEPLGFEIIGYTEPLRHNTTDYKVLSDSNPIDCIYDCGSTIYYRSDK